MPLLIWSFIWIAMTLRSSSLPCNETVGSLPSHRRLPRAHLPMVYVRPFCRAVLYFVPIRSLAGPRVSVLKACFRLAARYKQNHGALNVATD